jgi:hypothetical protein
LDRWRCSLQGPKQTDVVLECLRYPAGLLAAAGVRWQPFASFAVGASASYLPDDAKTRMLGLSVIFISPAQAKPKLVGEGDKEQEETAKPRTGKKTYTSDKPRFALALRQRPVPGEPGGPAPHYPGPAVAGAAEGAPTKSEASPPPEAEKPTEKPANAEEGTATVKIVESEVSATAPTLPVMRGNRIVQRRILDSVVIALVNARTPPKPNERAAIKALADRARRDEGDLVIWSTAIGSDSNQLQSAVGRAIAIKQLASRLSGLRGSKIDIQIGPGEAAARNRVLVALLQPTPHISSAKVEKPRPRVSKKPADETVALPAEPPTVPLAMPAAAEPTVSSPSTRAKTTAASGEQPDAGAPSAARSDAAASAAQTSPEASPVAREDSAAVLPPVGPDAGPSPTASRPDTAAVVPAAATSPDAAASPPDRAPLPRPEPVRVEPLVKVEEKLDAAPPAPDMRPDTVPARVERPVPLPPTLKEGASAQDQLRSAIQGFQPALKQCVDRALKRDPGLRGEAHIALDILSDGRVKLLAIKSKTLAGGYFESCVRTAAEQWRLPRTPKGYQIEIPLKIHIAGGGAP